MLNNKNKCNHTYYVQGLKYNLLSVSQLINTGHKIEFQKTKFKIYDNEGNLIETRVQTKGNLCYLDLTIHTCFIAKVEDVWLWKKRLCHVNFDNTVKVYRKKRIRGL